MNETAPPRSRSAAILSRLDAYERLVRLDKPIGILLLLWPTLSALWLAAHGTPRFSLVLIFTMGTILMRSAGCAFNDWADRRFDAHVARTAQTCNRQRRVQTLHRRRLQSKLASRRPHQVSSVRRHCQQSPQSFAPEK